MWGRLYASRWSPRSCTRAAHRAVRHTPCHAPKPGCWRGLIAYTEDLPVIWRLWRSLFDAARLAASPWPYRNARSALMNRTVHGG